ncbi:transposase [Salicibibacter cibi]|uniref:Transposase n=1 Tax=Salicibibacter cibi TaxID=2743001 RepID=A0A7T6ZCD4_9BACI|nr:transposase [Salicibibacter cibi]
MQRIVSRKYETNKEGDRYRKTRNIIKTEKEIIKLRTRLNNIRKDYIHKMTSEIARTKPSHIVIEDLNVKGMLKKKETTDPAMTNVTLKKITLISRVSYIRIYALRVLYQMGVVFFIQNRTR